MKTLFLCVVLAFAVRASGQTLSSVVIESCHYDAVHKTLSQHLVNHSHKTVTGFNISIPERYAETRSDSRRRDRVVYFRLANNPGVIT
jgi:hypothetical protein